MIGPIATGLLAAILVNIPTWVQGRFPAVSFPVFILGVATLAMVIQRFVVDRRSGTRTYDGLADLFIHIHSPSSPDSGLRWAARGVISLLFSICGAIVGPEGAAVELNHALAIRSRARTSRWFEQRRRTDASMSLAAGVSAAFGAPFTAVLLSIELGIGGRHVSAVVSALTAFLAGRYILNLTDVGALDLGGALYGYRFTDWRAWLGFVVIGAAAGAMGAVLVRFFRYAQESLLDLFQTQTWMRVLAAGVLLFLLMLMIRSTPSPALGLFEQVLWARRTPAEVGLLFSTGLLSLALVLAGFGTIGIFWPLFALGGFFGYGISHLFFADLTGFVPVAAFAGAAAFWGAMLGTPFSGAVLAYELTHHIGILLPCLLAGLIAREIRRRLRTPALIDSDLDARGMALSEGRSVSVLESVPVRDAMVTDHEIIHEQEPVSEIHARLVKSRYPFLPVVNSQNVYTGLLTVDMVQDAWQTQSATSNSPLAKLLEAKDLLYRSGPPTPTVKVNDRLTATKGIFESIPCAPVLSDDGRVVGLLFSYNIRLAYDREVSRRSLTFEDRES